MKYFACFLIVLALLAGVVSAKSHHNHRSPRKFLAPPPLQPASPPNPRQALFNIMDYKAQGDGINDDTKAFTSAWAAACKVPNSVLLMPASRTFLISQTTLQGPCHPGMVLQLDGKLVAPADPKQFNDTDIWLLFDSLESFTVRGNGMIDVRGAAWRKLSCKKNKSPDCIQRAPTAIKFFKCQDLTVKDIKIRNSQQMNLAHELTRPYHRRPTKCGSFRLR